MQVVTANENQKGGAWTSEDKDNSGHALDRIFVVCEKGPVLAGVSDQVTARAISGVTVM
jgi:hypothetical protein